VGKCVGSGPSVCPPSLIRSANDMMLNVCRMTRVILSGTTTAVAMGLGLSVLSATVYSTAGLPFVLFSCVGFCVGAVGWYRDAMAKSILALERYPLLLRLHLHANFPSERFDAWSVARMNSAFRRETFPHWRLTSMLVASWMTATPALDVSSSTRFSCC
jgi:hypothetical protein